jgi:hypothetical protein
MPKYTEENCPGHVASKADPKICDRCGIHIDSLRPDDCEHENTTMGFGLAGGGYGPYEYCEDCGSIIHKTQEEI